MTSVSGPLGVAGGNPRPSRPPRRAPRPPPRARAAGRGGRRRRRPRTPRPRGGAAGGRAAPGAPTARWVREHEAGTGEEQSLAGAVPQSKGEHAPETLDAELLLLLVEVDDRLGVASGAVPVATRLEAGTEGGVVVDLAVVDDPARLVLVGHGLLTARD